MSLGIKKTVTSKARENIGVIKRTIMFEKIEYIVKKIDGDYAYLKDVLNIKAMLKPGKRNGLKEFYFSTNTSSMRIKQFRNNPNASIYFS